MAEPKGARHKGEKMRAVHNTPIPHEAEFPIPDDCVCDGGELCQPCQAVVDEDLAEQQREQEANDKYLEELGWEMEAEACAVCDGLGHSAGEYGELCLANGRAWFQPSDPRDLYDGEEGF